MTNPTPNKNDYFAEHNARQMDKLTAVGFTEDQARAILEIAQEKALMGGFL